MQFVRNVLVYVFEVFTFSFWYCFYEGFIHKTILVSWFLPFVCISYPLKVFKFNTGILHDSCAVLLMKTLSRLPQSTAFLCLILFLMFACNNFPFRAFLTMIYWTPTEILLNLVAPLDLAVPSLDFEQINVFWTSSFDSASIVFDWLSVSRISQNCISSVPSSDLNMVHGFDSISIAQFHAMIYSVWTEGSLLNRVAYWI